MDSIIQSKIIALILKNKYAATVSGQKDLFNDLKLDKSLSNYAFLLKDLTGSEASALGYIIMYSSYKCEFYKEGSNKFAKFKKPYVLHSESQIRNNLDKNLKEANETHGYIDVPVLKGDKKAIEVNAKKLKDLAYKKNYSNTSLSIDNESKIVLFLVFGSPIIFFLILLSVDINNIMSFSWEGSKCYNEADWFSDEENKFLSNLGIANQVCNEPERSSYPILYKFLLSFALFFHIGITGSKLAEYVEQKNISPSIAIFIFLISLPFVVIILGRLIYLVLGGIISLF